MLKLVSNYIDSNESKGLVGLFNKHREVMMYLVFGVITTIVSVLTRILLFHTVCNPDKALEVQIATIISNAVGITFAYFTNRKYVFESTNKNRLKEAFSFVTGRLSTLAMDMLIMFVGVTVLKGNETLITLISQFIVIVANYLISKLFVFKKEKK
ncbi:MAG: GtrA family protein [Bacilli bacterium]|nr:GtrA family protein [Bacilli bacterium]